MNKAGKFLVLIASVVLTACGQAEEAAPTEEAPNKEVSTEVGVAYAPMVHFAPLAGKAWRGEGTGPDGKAIVDIARYEMILGGRAFQSTHRLQDGSYGGRTIIFYDEGAEAYIFHYFTTAGFHTTGEITLTETGFISVEKVQGHAVYAEVRAEAFFEGDTIRIESSHVTKDGEASKGEGMIYRAVEDPGALYK